MRAGIDPIERRQAEQEISAFKDSAPEHNSPIDWTPRRNSIRVRQPVAMVVDGADKFKKRPVRSKWCRDGASIGRCGTATVTVVCSQHF